MNLPPLNMPSLDMKIPTAAERARAEYLGNNFAGDILRKLMNQVRAFEALLSEDEEIGFSVQTSSGFEQISVDQVRALPPETLIFLGVDIDGSRVALVQHASQTNVLLRAIRKRAETAHRIGFHIGD